MPPEGRDLAHLVDMLEHAKEALEFAGERNLAEYVADRRLQLAVERALEIVGEAARRVTATYREAHPELPWRKVVALRNVLAHDHGDVDPVLIWGLLRKQLPDLVRQLEELLAE